MKQIIVTVGREHGSGGKYIAEQIAKQLGIAFYDKELLLASVFNAEDAARYDEKPVHLLWSRRIGENFNALMGAVIKAKPAAAKGQYIRSCTVASTMGPGIKVNAAKLG